MNGYFSLLSLKFWLLYTVADVIGLLVGFYIFGYFYLNSAGSFPFYWNQVIEFSVWWYVGKFYLPVQVVAFIAFWHGKFLKLDLISTFRLVVFFIHTAVCLMALQYSPFYIISQPVFWIGWSTVLAFNVLAFVIFEITKQS